MKRLSLIVLALLVSGCVTYPSPEVENNAEFCYIRGMDCFYRGDFDKAISEYTKALEINPSYASAYYNRAFSWRQKGVLEKALNDARLALSLGPDNRLYQTAVVTCRTELALHKARAQVER